MKFAAPAIARELDPARLGDTAASAVSSLWSGPRAMPWLMLSLGAALGLIAPEFTVRFAAWPFVLALLIFGMPHGAADWAVMARLNGTVGFRRRLIGFAEYLWMMFACALFLIWQPGFFAMLFLALTIFHFGMTDAAAVRADAQGEHARWCFVLGRGLLLLGTTFAMHPQSAWSPFAEIANALAWKPESMWMPDLPHLQKLSAIGAVVGAGLALYAVITRAQRGDAREASFDLIEHALVAILAGFADPLFAVGLFFFTVHAYRHTRRLACTRAVIEPPAAPVSLVRRLARVHAISLPLMWPTALCLIPICMRLGPLNARTLAMAGIVFYMITTLSHHLLGLRLPKPDLAPVP